MDIFNLPWAEAEPLFHALSRSKTLSHISISTPDGQNIQDLLDHSLTPIRQLRTLRLKLSCCCTNLDNDLLLEAMSSWPHIRMLEFIDTQAVPNVTFRGLFAALHRSPRLHTLDIPLDAVNINIDPAAESFQLTSLQRLNLTSSNISDAEAVVRIIFSALPSVDRILPPGDKRPPDVYYEVQRHLESFHITGAASET